MREDGDDNKDEYFDADEVGGMFIMTRPLAGLSQQEKVFRPSLHILSQIYFAIWTNTFGNLDKYILVGLSQQVRSHSVTASKYSTKCTPMGSSASRMLSHKYVLVFAENVRGLFCPPIHILVGGNFVS